MAVAYIQEFAIGDRTTTNYDFVADKIGDGPFQGLIAHTAGFDDEAGVFRILDVWETREDAERFLAEQVQPVVEGGAAGVSEPRQLRGAHARRLLRASPRRALGESSANHPAEGSPALLSAAPTSSTYIRASPTLTKPSLARTGMDMRPAWTVNAGVPRSTASCHRAAVSAR